MTRDTMTTKNTLGETFTMRVRSQYDDDYEFRAILSGWEIRHGRTHNGECDARGEPHLYRKLSDNHLTYPSDLGFYLELLYEHSRDGSKSRDEIQGLFNTLSDYLANINRVPKPEIE